MKKMSLIMVPILSVSIAAGAQGSAIDLDNKVSCLMDGKTLPFKSVPATGSTLVTMAESHLSENARLVFENSPYYDFGSRLSFINSDIRFVVATKSARSSESAHSSGGFVFKGANVVCKLL